jgi:hypothetical protein
MESESERLDRQIVDMRIAGKGEGEISRLLGVTVADVHRAVDAQASAALSAQNNVRMIYLQSQRLEELEAAFMPQAKAGDVASGALVVKIQERRATLMGLNAPLRVDPIQLTEAMQPQLNSTERVLAAIHRLKADDPKRKMNGGAGYGDERDDEDEKLIQFKRGELRQ